MLVSPVDISAWASDTGNPYPATPAEKAAVLPDVAAWKAEQIADARDNRGNNALATPLMVAGGVGLGLAGLAAFKHFKKQGLSDPEASQRAKEVEETVRAAVDNPPAAAAPAATVADAPPAAAAPAPVAAGNPDDRDIRPRSGRYDGPRLRTDTHGATAEEVITSNGVVLGSAGARAQGQYKARSSEGFHNPALAALRTPAEREAYLAGIAEAKGAGSREFKEAQQQIAAMATQTGPGVDPLSFLSSIDQDSGLPRRIGDAARYGTTTAEEELADGNFLQQSRTKANKSAQAGYVSREDALASSSKPEAASNFYQDSDGSLRPYRGSETLLDADGNVALDRKGNPEYTGLKSDGSAIRLSDLQYLPTDDPLFYERSGLEHPSLKSIEVRFNAGDKRDLRYAVEEDQMIAGTREPLGPSDSRFSDGIRDDGVADNWVFGRVERDGPKVPLMLSGFQAEMESPGMVAGSRLRRATDDHRLRTGAAMPMQQKLMLAMDLAKEHGVDPATVIKVAGGVSAAPKPEREGRTTAHALGGGGSGDALDRVYTSLGMHAGADAWELEDALRDGNVRAAAAALAPTLPGYAAANGRLIRGASMDEQLNVVAEGVAAGLKDLAVTLQKRPELAEQFGVGKGPGGFGVDAYLKSYVRDWVTVRGLQLDPTGQPSFHIPNDAYEEIAYKASQGNRSVLAQLEQEIRGSKNGLDAALKIDRMVSGVQSTKEGDPNNNATRLAQTVFSMEDDDLVSTQLLREAAGDVRISVGGRRAFDSSAGFIDRNPSEQLIDQRLAETGVPGFTNRTLAARLKGIPDEAPDAQQRRGEVEAIQTWIQENAADLERGREDFNRGIVQTEQGPRNFGRGFVISSDDRGAFLAGNTQGMNASYVEERKVDSDDLTPLDRAQDSQREAVLNNQIDPDDTVAIDGAVDRELAPLHSEADRTAAEYGKTKLYFKNLGPDSAHAMPAGEAYAPRQLLRQVLAERGHDINISRKLDQVLGSTWRPEPGTGIEVGAAEPIRGIGPKPAPPAAPAVLDAPGIHEPTLVTRPSGIPDGAVDPYQNWYRPAAARRGTVYGERPITLIGGETVAIPTIELHGTWAPRPTHPRQPLSSEQLIGMYGMQPRAEVPAISNTATAALHREALEARAVNGGEGFRDDQRLRDASAGPTLFDKGEVSGYGRSGSTFEQAPIAAAPISRAHTLEAAAAPSVPGISATERNDAAARHLGDWISKAATPGFNSAGRQVSGWAGGDSWQGGARLAGRADANVSPYRAPSDTMLNLLATAARRRRGGV